MKHWSVGVDAQLKQALHIFSCIDPNDWRKKISLAYQTIDYPRSSTRFAILMYGVLAYVAGVSALLYKIAFIGNMGPIPTIDGSAKSPILIAATINIGLIVLFGLQHSIMARPSFKRIWTRIVPPAAERSTYLLATVAVLAVFFLFWQPMPIVLWSVESGIWATSLCVAYFAGWALLLFATFQINHFELFGLQQVWSYFRGQTPVKIPFHKPWLYRLCRHPMQLGILIAIWSTPTMTAGRLLFAVGMTAYVFVGLYFEERDLIRSFGKSYDEYRKRVPMLLPSLHWTAIR
ncbi:MAG: methanethiol S-methyltransferase [Pseudomonadota bacterium]